MSRKPTVREVASLSEMIASDAKPRCLSYLHDGEGSTWYWLQPDGTWTMGLPAPIELVRKGDDNQKVLAYACSFCGTVRGTYTDAERHCLPRTCSKCKRLCNSRYAVVCSKCSSEERRRVEAARFRKADKVSVRRYEREYVFVEDRIMSVEEAEDELLERSDEDEALWAYAAKRVPWTLPNAADLIEDMYERMGMDEGRPLDPKPLQGLIDQWAATLPESNWYEEDTSLVVVFREPGCGDE